MAPEHVELMERVVELWNAGDWEGVFAFYDDDVVLEDNLLPDGDTYRGVEAVRERMYELRSLAGGWQVETESIMDVGAEVVWLSRVTGRLDEDTPPFDFRSGVVVSFEGGAITKFRWFATPEQALEAAGLGA